MWPRRAAAWASRSASRPSFSPLHRQSREPAFRLVNRGGAEGQEVKRSRSAVPPHCNQEILDRARLGRPAGGGRGEAGVTEQGREGSPLFPAGRMDLRVLSTHFIVYL